ncbi:MAG TPA: N-formylglutamate amidohydrolase, partial [Gammaproteobacteria bacterium]|nr:N-formylglutamate amidohydrolase [Gammaproteobacteria bacterium]
AMGITTIYGTYSRFVADVNRPPILHGAGSTASYVASTTFQGEPIYSDSLDDADLTARRDLVYAPYHARLTELIQSRVSRSGGAVLLDMHSLDPQVHSATQLPPADVYLGDGMGETNSGWLTDVIERGFRSAGLEVRRNQPFSGGYITRHYGTLPRVSALHVELRQGLYLQENEPDRLPTHAGFNAFKSTLSDVFTGLVHQIQARGIAQLSRIPIRPRA